MKTVYKSLLLGGIFLFVLSPLISNKLIAQPLHNNNQPAYKIIELGTIDSGGDNKPNKLILVYDSTSLTFEFTQDGELAQISTSNTLYSHLSGGKTSSKYSSEMVLSEQYIQSLINNAIVENADEEEEMELQEWMIHPEGWLDN